MPKIELEKVTVIYRNSKRKSSDVFALNEVSQTFENGAFNVIVGASGCGKTTLVKCILGLLSYSGHIFFDGIDSDSLRIEERNAGYVSQQYGLYPHIDVFDNIAFPLRVKGCSREEIISTVTKIAKELGIYDCLSRKPKYLSGGQQQRVALARALAKNPSLYIFDEPLSNLDPTIREEARKLIKQLMSRNNATVIYVTHDIREAFELADYIYVMDESEIVFKGTPRETKDSHIEVVKSLLEATYKNGTL